MVDSMLKRLTANPAIADNPQAQSYIQVLQSGDAAKGEELANNLIETYGMTKEQALSQAKQFFHIG
jgi:hypothetical protein